MDGITRLIGKGQLFDTAGNDYGKVRYSLRVESAPAKDVTGRIAGDPDYLWRAWERNSDLRLQLENGAVWVAVLSGRVADGEYSIFASGPE